MVTATRVTEAGLRWSDLFFQSCVRLKNREAIVKLFTTFCVTEAGCLLLCTYHTRDCHVRLPAL